MSSNELKNRFEFVRFLLSSGSKRIIYFELFSRRKRTYACLFRSSLGQTVQTLRDNTLSFHFFYKLIDAQAHNCALTNLEITGLIRFKIPIENCILCLVYVTYEVYIRTLKASWKFLTAVITSCQARAHKQYSTF